MIYEGSLLYIYVNNSNRIPKGIIKKAQIRNISSVTIIDFRHKSKTYNLFDLKLISKII
jgi:hypothetical protein